MFLLPVHIQVCIVSALALFRVPSVELTKESLLSLLALMPVGSVWGVWMALGSGRSHVFGGWRMNLENSEDAWLHTHARELGRQVVYDVMHRCDESGRKWMKARSIHHRESFPTEMDLQRAGGPKPYFVYKAKTSFWEGYIQKTWLTLQKKEGAEVRLVNHGTALGQSY